MKKIILLLLAIVSIFALFAGCEKQKQEPETEQAYKKYSYTFLDTFDTVTQVVGYTETEEEFNLYAEEIHDRMLELHMLYDKYNDYEGINNIKTINDYAGVKPVKVDKDIIDLILFSKDMYENVGKQTNIAMGSVLKIWHDYRDEAEADPLNAKIPPMDILLAANEHTDLSKVMVDVEDSTVYLDDPLMSLDVGAVAKGYATEVIVQEIVKEGFTSGIISAGGNIRTFGKPLDGQRNKWGVGIQNPESVLDNSQESVLETVFANDSSVVTSGDYQRFYMVGDKTIHHLIDPKTLMPGDYFRAVSILTENSGRADFLSTTVFLLPYEEGKALVESLDGVEALWIFKDGTIEVTEGMKKIMKSYGASGTDGN
ncbi:MAG: FAD:protein FMN transferase [Sedimentibacter sp.]|uniref:FAD:protein FMN transferase n=1 Tax=Sedimentibacter sp. TaxID=1960295 RepID=UPI002982AB4C|nr:FAD:protein FMN transferase [Sedimentibacter sp.]MDW5299035.1 FAD:protein FMN transferase [Sedimentibacter sp.]